MFDQHKNTFYLGEARHALVDEGQPKTLTNKILSDDRNILPIHQYIIWKAQRKNSRNNHQSITEVHRE